MVYNYILIMQLNPPLKRDADITNMPNARYTVKEHARVIKEHKK
jgi:hypothetical protein